MGMSMLDWIEMQVKKENGELPTQQEFGKLMHGTSMTEEEKIELAKAVELAGGYASLVDDFRLANDPLGKH